MNRRGVPDMKLGATRNSSWSTEGYAMAARLCVSKEYLAMRSLSLGENVVASHRVHPFLELLTANRIIRIAKQGRHRGSRDAAFSVLE